MAAVLLCVKEHAGGAPAGLNPNLQIRLVLNTTNSSGASSIRIRKDPRNNQLYYLKYNGDVFRLSLQPGTGSSSTRVYSAANHGISTSALGMTIGPDGTMYVVGNTTTKKGRKKHKYMYSKERTT